jgi:anaerobic selenocysteine-containing dehydrogenase
LFIPAKVKLKNGGEKSKEQIVAMLAFLDYLITLPKDIEDKLISEIEEEAGIMETKLKPRGVSKILLEREDARVRAAVKEANKIIAEKLLKRNEDPESVSELTGLPLEEIQNLAK